jgi:hypothetical protein
MKRVAAVVTTYFPASHADVIVSRWLHPRASDADWGWNAPKTRIASLYVAQTARRDPANPEFNGDDISREMAARHDIPLCESVRDALTLGTNALAVDGVLLVGEHGVYPTNELGQKLYPRKELFDEVVAVFRESGRAVPLFCDKHLSWNPQWADEMVATARELGFPLMAGSSLPWAGVVPEAARPPAGTPISEYIGLFYCGADVYGFHSLELMQSLIEQRPGGAAGIRAVRAYAGEAVWNALDRGEWSRDLFDAALAQVRGTPPGPDVRANCYPNPEFPGQPSPIAFCLEHADGLRSTHVLLHGHLSEFTFALRGAENEIRAGGSRSSWGGPDTFFGHFASLNAAIETMFLTGEAPVPIERTLLTTKTIAACLRALRTRGEVIPTPGLLIPYDGGPTT